AVKRLGLSIAIPRPGSDRTPDDLRLGLLGRHGLATAARHRARAREQEDDCGPDDPDNACRFSAHDSVMVAYWPVRPAALNAVTVRDHNEERTSMGLWQVSTPSARQGHSTSRWPGGKVYLRTSSIGS